MKSYPLLAVCMLVLFCSLTVAQRSGNAQDFYKRGVIQYESGDLENAIIYFTNAIELSTRLTKPPKSSNGLFPSTSDSEQADRIRVVDPLAAGAYCNRG